MVTAVSCIRFSASASILAGIYIFEDLSEMSIRDRALPVLRSIALASNSASFAARASESIFSARFLFPFTVRPVDRCV